MKIAHAGGYSFISDALVSAQREAGHECLFLGDPGLSGLFYPANGAQGIYRAIEQVRDFRPQIVHFHSLASLLFPEGQRTSLEKLLQALKGLGARIVLQTCPGDLDLVPQTALERIVSALPLVDYCLVGSPDLVGYFTDPQKWHRFALPIPAENFPTSTPPMLEKGGKLRVLLLKSAANEQDRRLLYQALADTPGLASRLETTELEAVKIQSLAEFTQALLDCDIFLDSLRRFWPSEAAILALACGRQVILGPQDTQRPWPQLDLSPLMFTDAQRLGNRLELIIREPICLRDFAKRSRQYALTYHNVALMNTVLLDLYERLAA
jgi:hypothetical protein